MAEGITYRGSSYLGQPSLEEPEYEVEQPDYDLESLAKTPEGLDLEPMDPVYLLSRELWQAVEDERARKASEAAWAARRKVA